MRTGHRQRGADGNVGDHWNYETELGGMGGRRHINLADRKLKSSLMLLLNFGKGFRIFVKECCEDLIVGASFL
jgi:hypothetical protein